MKITNDLTSIFDDDLFDDLTKQPENKTVERIDSEIIKFQEITSFVKERGREPKRTADWSNERALWARLQGFRNKKERADKVRKYDELNLLNSKNNSAEFLKLLDIYPEQSDKSTINDILDKDDLLDGTSDLLDISRYKKTINMTSKKSSRHHVSNFESYKILFDQIHADIASGKRKIIPFEQYDIEEGRFYVQNGIMLYIVSIDRLKKDKNGDSNAKMHVVYENGTENKALWLRSLSASLYSTERHGRMITDLIDEITFSKNFSNDFTTGFIYVLKSLNQSQEIRKLKNLYKIGFTRTDVNSRISNAKNEVTYLNAPVKVVLSAEVKNVNAQLVERMLHHAFQKQRVDFQDSTYKKATEWYIISIEEIQNKINEIFSKLQS